MWDNDPAFSSWYKLNLKHWIWRKSDAVYGSHVRIDIDIITGSIRDNHLINQDIDLVNILTQLSGPAPALSYLCSHINFHELLLLIQWHELHHNLELASLSIQTPGSKTNILRFYFNSVQFITLGKALKFLMKWTCSGAGQILIDRANKTGQKSISIQEIN